MYVQLYGILFLLPIPTLFTYFLDFDIPTYSEILNINLFSILYNYDSLKIDSIVDTTKWCDGSGGMCNYWC